MITEWWLDVIENALLWLAGLFPVVNLDDTLGAWSMVLGYMGDMDYFLPIHEVFAITLAVFVIFPALMGISLLVWLAAIIRGGSSRG